MLGAAWGSAGRPIRSLTSALIVTAALLVAPPLASPAVATNHACGPSGNKIACENSKPGTPREVWDDFYGAGASSIQGYAAQMSVNLGERVDFKIDTDASAYKIDVYRTGYYGGDGARKIASVKPSASLPQRQPNCITDPTTELYDCGNWAVSASWTVPTNAVSGVYIARLHRADTDEASHITFVVRDDASRSDLVFQTSDTTWQAYNTYGGSNYYWGGANGRAYKVSYNRPITTRGDVPGGRDFYFANEYPLVRFLEQNGYDVSYISGIDTHSRPGLLTRHKTFLSVGHDEYWTGAQRDNVVAARDAGVNLMFLSGNEMYWRSRFEPSIDGNNTPLRTLVTYKETWDNKKTDPAAEWTGTWRDPRFAPKSQGAGLPENSVSGTLYMVNNDDLALTVSADEGKLRLWRHTELAALPPGSSRALAPHTVGYESNEDLDNGYRPEGLIRLSTTTGPTPEYLQDFGNTVKPGTTTHHLTMYRATSGARVFSAGSVQWTWGLDAVHDSPYPPEPADPRMRQAQVNLLADFGAQPTTLANGLTQATASTDVTGPTTANITPTEGTAHANGARVTVTGIAADVDGVVAGVEVSTDGKTWHPATGTTSWSYTYVQHGTGAQTIRARAIDDSGNIGAGTTRSIQVSCPCSVFGSSVPAVPAADDGGATELGLRFTPDVDGFVSGVRFYKGPGNDGIHVGTLWSSTGQQLARVTFADETASGWQSAKFAVPVAVTAGTTYVVSYTAPRGRYAAQIHAFADRGVEAPPLKVAGGFGATPAGVFGAAGSFPANDYRWSNYFVDVLFTTIDESPLLVVEHDPMPDSSSVLRDTAVSARFTKAVTSGTEAITLTRADGQAVAGATSYDPQTRRITFTPASPLDAKTVYTARVSGRDNLGKDVSEGGTWSFETAAEPGTPGVCPCSLFDDTTRPEVLEVDDRNAVTLGVRFAPQVDGTVSAVRFFKGPGNTGEHTGALWAMDGTQLAGGTFTRESTTGWQTLVFDAPVRVRKNTEYVASYRAPKGAYSATLGAFGRADLSKPPLRVASDAGAYTYGTGFPSASSSTSYLVDVVFDRLPPMIEVVDRRPAADAVDVARSTDLGIWFSSQIKPGWSMTVEAGGAPVPGTAQLGVDGSSLVFTPQDPLPRNTLVTATVSGVVSVEDVVLPTQSWSFRTADSSDTGPQRLMGSTVPAIPLVDDTSPIELGMAFVPGTDGYVTEVRFFKGGPANGGTHTGSLWTATGERLATVTFANETPSGWQTARLADPVPLVGGRTYVVSYYAPRGHYSATTGYFATPRQSGDLTAPPENGRYVYGAGGGFPGNVSGNASSYFVDVGFVAGAAPAPEMTISSRNPAPNETSVPRAGPVSVTFSEPLGPGHSMTVSAPSGPLAGSVATSTDGRTLSFTPSQLMPAETLITVQVSGIVSAEGAAMEPASWSFTTEPRPVLTASLFDGLTPEVPNSSNTQPIEVGTHFVPLENGAVTALKFYKGSQNGGTHTVSLWRGNGTRLARVTVTGETASGWQTTTLPTPVEVTAGNTYVVSYHAQQGRQSLTSGFWTSGSYTNGPLRANRNQNGRYRFTATASSFPNSIATGTNYFVDVVLRYLGP